MQFPFPSRSPNTYMSSIKDKVPKPHSSRGLNSWDGYKYCLKSFQFMFVLTHQPCIVQGIDSLNFSLICQRQFKPPLILSWSNFSIFRIFPPRFLYFYLNDSRIMCIGLKGEFLPQTSLYLGTGRKENISQSLLNFPSLLTRGINKEGCGSIYFYLREHQSTYRLSIWKKVKITDSISVTKNSIYEAIPSSNNEFFEMFDVIFFNHTSIKTWMGGTLDIKETNIGGRIWRVIQKRNIGHRFIKPHIMVSSLRRKKK